MKGKLYFIILLLLSCFDAQSSMLDYRYDDVVVDTVKKINSIKDYIEINNLLYPEFCVEYGLRGLHLSQEYEDINYQFYFTYKIGEAYSKLDILDESMNYTLQAYGLAKIINDTATVVSSLNALCNLYLKTEMISRAQSYNTSAIQEMEFIDDEQLKGDVLLLRGKIEMHTDSVINAINYLEQASFYYKKIEYDRGIADVDRAFGDVYQKLNMLSLALDSYKKSKKVYRKIKDYRLVLDIQLSMIQIYFSEKKYDETKEIVNIVLKKAKMYSYDNFLLRAYMYKAKLAEIDGDSEEALTCYKHYMSIRESVNETKIQREIVRLEVEHQTKQRKKENAELQNELHRQERYKEMGFFFSILVVFFSILVVLFFRYKQQNRISNTLIAFNNELEKRVAEKTKALEQEVEEKKKKTKEAILAKKRAQESDKLKEEFLNAISHEIRTPMNGIMGFASLMKESDNISEVKTFSSAIYRKSNDLLHIIEEIIQVARLKSENISLKRENVMIQDVLSDVRCQFEDCNTKNVKWIVDCDIDLQTRYIYTDRGMLKIMLYHLMSNAFKFTEQGEVQLFVRDNEDTISFHVKDTGIGMFPEEISFIFDYFRQVDGSNTRKYGGVGIGLTIVKHIVEMLGGKVKVLSDKNVGSEFIVYFSQDKISENGQEKNKEVKRAWSDKNVLLYNETRKNTKYLQDYFTMNHSEFIHATTQRQVMEAIENFSLDLIFIDDETSIKLSSLLKKIREKNSSVPIILQTSYGVSLSMDEVRKAGYDDFLVKPIAFNVLKEKLEDYFFV